MEYSYITYHLKPIEVIVLDGELYFSIKDLTCADVNVVINKSTMNFIRCFRNNDIVGYCRKLNDDGELFVSEFDFKKVCYGLQDYVYDNFSLLRFGNNIINYKEYTSRNKSKLEYYNSFILFNKRCK